jgi:hypothetical protein
MYPIEMPTVLVVCVFLQRNFGGVAELTKTDTLVSSLTFIHLFLLVKIPIQGHMTQDKDNSRITRSKNTTE